MNKIDPDFISIPSSLRVFPTSNQFPLDFSVPGEVDHLKTNTCPHCGGWQTQEECVVWKPGGMAVRRTVIRCHGHRERWGPRCAPNILREVPMDDYAPPAK